MDAHDTDHIWLRQTITFTVDGQTRTLEVGIPVPRNATAQEVEALLEVADAGMSALSRRLDARITESLTGSALLPAPAIPGAPADGSLPTMPTTTQTQETISANSHAPEETARQVTGEPREQEPARNAPGSAAPRTAAAAPQAPAPAPSPAPERAPAPQRPASQPPRPQAPDAPAARQAPAAPPAQTDPQRDTQGEMTRPQFLAAAAELGLNPRQAMDHLGVRSLEGLNLREALESLRRQLLGAASQPEPEPEPEPTPEPAPAPLAAAPSAPAQYFDEEDDETIFFALDDELPEDERDEDDGAPILGGDARRGINDDADGALDEDEIDLDDVPDLSPPPTTPTRQRSAPATRKAPSTVNTIHESSSPAPEQASNGTRTHAMQLIGKLRSATGGGAASDYQRNAYRNIVENELGKTQATTLIRGLWRTTADRLTAGQLDALIRWGKEEVFAEEAAQVLATLRAEQRRAEQPETSASDAGHPRARAATRARPGEGSR